ncbi:MAG: SCO6880 family protein [Acidimicrobiales bacterium]
MAAEREDRVYRFDPADTSGVFLGLGLIQCGLIGGGLVASVTGLTQGVPLLLAAVPAAVGVVGSFARVGGYVLWQWLPMLAGWAWMRLGRGRRWLAPIPLVPDSAGAATALPPCLAGVSIIDVPWRGRQRLGAVRDDERKTLTAAVRVAGPQFVVQARSDQERLLSGWGDILNQFAVDRGPVTHLTWSDYASPSGLEEHRAWLASVEGGERNGEARASYGELLAGATASATAHDVIVTMTVSRDRLGRRRASTTDSDVQLARALSSSVEALLRGARSAGLVPGEPLAASEFQRAVRTRFDPVASRPVVTGGRLVERLGFVTAANAGPMALETYWRHIRVDGAFHRTYQVTCWPRLPVAPSWLEPFLAGSGLTRTMTVVFCPVSAYQSRRRIERDLVKLESDATTKEDKGRRVDARHRRATQSLLDREQELVAGFAEMGYAALVSLSAPTEESLEEQAEIVEHLAREAGMELRCLDARQDLAWAAALPLGLAPRNILS